jgi:hypothetical protein
MSFTKMLNFLGEWISTSIMLLFEPARFIPVAKSPIQGAALTATTRKHVGFSASAVLVATVIVQIADQHDLYARLTQSAPLALLTIGAWLIWSIILSGILRALDGIQPPITNIVFGIRMLATFYVFSVVVGTIAFLALRNRWPVSDQWSLNDQWDVFASYFPASIRDALSQAGDLGHDAYGVAKQVAQSVSLTTAGEVIEYCHSVIY